MRDISRVLRVVVSVVYSNGYRVAFACHYFCNLIRALDTRTASAERAGKSRVYLVDSRANLPCASDERIYLRCNEDLLVFFAELTAVGYRFEKLLTGDINARSFVEVRHVKGAGTAALGTVHKSEIVVEHNMVGMLGCYRPCGRANVFSEILVKRTADLGGRAVVKTGVLLECRGLIELPAVSYRCLNECARRHAVGRELLFILTIDVREHFRLVDGGVTLGSERHTEKRHRANARFYLVFDVLAVFVDMLKIESHY